jgi:hypothetical protein
MVGSLTASAGGLENDVEVLFQLALTDEVVEPLGPQADLVGFLVLGDR